MRRNAHIIQISGIKGILLVISITSCLVAGFVAFPAFVAMYAWNFAAGFLNLPSVNFLQGLMLWAIVAISLFLINERGKYLVSAKHQLSEEEIQDIMNRVRMQAQAKIINSMILKSNEFQNKDTEHKEDKENV